MKVYELIKYLSSMEPESEVVVMTSHHEGDDVTDWTITCVHDHWSRVNEHDLVSIEINLDQREGYFTFPEYDRVISGFMGTLNKALSDPELKAELDQQADAALAQMESEGLVTTSTNAEGVVMVELTEKGKAQAFQASASIEGHKVTINPSTKH
jgi:hypothetical protein